MPNANEDCNNCAVEVRLEALEEGLQKCKAEHKEFYDRLRAIEITNALQGERYEIILQKINTISESVDALTSAPGKKWNELVDKVMFAIIGAVIALVLSTIGLQ